MNIDDIADRETNQPSPGERFHEQWLDELPVGQWPSYIDESAQLVADGIFIGKTELTSADFGSETGEYYRRGLAQTADIDPSQTSLPLGNHSAEEIGSVAWTFNRLREEIRNSKYTDFENPSRAIEAAINKALVEQIESGQLDSEELETIRLPESATVSTLVSEVFCRPRSETYIELLLNTVRENVTTGLLDHIEEPRMVTPLWAHQREALDAWLSNDCRGYVDMATATGKTVLGLAAIAHHFGALHPTDRDLRDERFQTGDETRARVVVIAHRDLILDQWKREFDIHLNIPEQSSTQSGEHTVDFEWGDVHFWTPSRLKNSNVLKGDIDLVVLDETHHYLGSSGFGSILDEIDGHVLALSGSLDDSNARTLERRGIPQLYEFTLQEGQAAGVIPECDWDVVFTPYENQSELADVTTRCQEGFERYSDGIEIPRDIDADTTELSFENLSEARSITQSSVGRELKERNEEFREFASAVMARQLTQYNLSPDLSTVVHLVLDHADQHKCVVLLETSDEIDRVTDALESRLGDAYGSLITVLDDEADLSVVERFDRDQSNGAIIGVARTLGEGVDIETADVCINRGRGRLSRSLIQRMGRILRNPDGDKHAQFFHVSGVPTRDEATMPQEDGVMLLETASQLLAWGESFEARPVFEVDTESAMSERKLMTLENAGASAIIDWSPDHYEWPTDEDIQDHLESICSEVREHDESALLSIERPSRDPSDGGGATETDPSPNDRLSEQGIQFVAADGGGIEVAGWLHGLVEAATPDTESFVEDSVRTYVQETISAPKQDLDLKTQDTKQVALNPALDALLSAYIDDGRETVAVHAALAEAIREDIPELAEASDTNESIEELRSRIEALANQNV